MAKILSIEIDEQNIKILEGLKKGELLSIYKCIILNTPLKSVDDGKIINITLVKEAIEKAFIENSIQTKRAIFIINTNSIITRKIELPLLKSKTETLSMIKFELDQLFSAELSQYKLIYKKTETFNVNGFEKANYIVYGLPVKMYNQYLELSEKLKLEMQALNLSFNYLDEIKNHEIAINGKKIKTNCINAFINIGYNTIVFSVVNNGINDFSRTYLSGIGEIVEKFKSDFKLEQNDALVEIEKSSLFENSNTTSYDTQKKDIIEGTINTWIDVFNRYIIYYNSVNKDKKIEKIFLYGSYVKIGGLEQYLSSNLNMEFETINDISNIKILNDSTIACFDINKYFNCLLSFNANKNSLNFLTDKHKMHKKVFNVGVAVMAVSVILVLIFAFYVLGYSIQKNTLKKEIEAMNLFINNQTNINNNNEIEELKNNVKHLEKYKSEIGKLKEVIKSENAVNSDVFKKINEATPAETVIITIFIDKENIQLQCSSRKLKDVSLIEENLRSINLISNVYIPRIEMKNDNGVVKCSYSVICELKGVKNIETK